MNKLIKLFIFICLVACLPVSFAAPPAKLTEGNTLAPVMKKILPAIVNISILGQIPASKLPPGTYLPNQLVPGPNREPALQFLSVGSGVIINAAKGYIVTNAHVLREAQTVAVTLNDGRRLRAKIIGQDKATDIAVIQVKTDNLTQIEFAPAHSLNVGDFVAAIGNPYGLHQSVTSGLVSALNREIGVDGNIKYENFIQTDAPINPGNSGGALVNIQGQLVGINTGILSQSGGSMGIGFAIPADIVNSVAKQLIQFGKVKHGLLGVVVQVLTPDLAKAFEMPNAQGILVTQINPGSAADKAGIKTKDIIESVNGEQMRTPNQLRYLVGITPIGDKLTIALLRDKKQMTVTATISDGKKLIATGKKTNLLAGVTLKDIEILDQNLGYIKGLQVLGVDYKSAAWLAGLSPGDVILSANNQPTESISALLEIASKGNALLLQVQRNAAQTYIVVNAADEDVNEKAKLNDEDENN